MSGTLAQAVEQACAADLATVDAPELQQLVLELQQAAGKLRGRADQVLAELAERSDGLVLENPDSQHAPLWTKVQTWWREASTISGGQAGRDLRRAAVLRRLPVLGQAVTDGILSPAQAAVLCRLDGRIDHDDLVASQQHLVQVASVMDPEALGLWVRHQIATHCEPILEADEDAAERRRHLQVVRNPDGTVTGRFVLADADAEAVLTVLEPLARRQGLRDDRSAGQRRADALVEVCTGALQWMELPQAGGQRPQLSYVVPAGWACGERAPSLHELLASGLLTLPVTGAPDDPRDGAHPQALEEHCATATWTGPQTRTRIEMLLCDARLTRVLRSSIGQVIGLQSLTDDVTPAQRRALVARDRHCVAQGCTRPPAFCDAHHLLHRADGGPTSLDNPILLCRRHHVLWHRAKLRLSDLHVPWMQDVLSPAPLRSHAPPRVA
jgi:hypothetical protein